MKPLVLIAAALTFAVPASAGTKDPGFPLAGPWDSVAFELKSWGTPVVSWSLSSSGAGLLTDTVTPEGAGFGRYDLVWHQLNVGAEDYAQLATILRRLPFPAPAYDACEERATDFPYGTLTIKQGSTAVTLDFNMGCGDDDYQAYVDTLKAASDLVESWAKDTPVVRTEQVGVKDRASK